MAADVAFRIRPDASAGAAMTVAPRGQDRRRGRRRPAHGILPRVERRPLRPFRRIPEIFTNA